MSLILALKLIDVLAAIVAVGSTVTDAYWRLGRPGALWAAWINPHKGSVKGSGLKPEPGGR
jgi:hypothetical protein